MQTHIPVNLMNLKSATRKRNITAAVSVHQIRFSENLDHQQLHVEGGGGEAEGGGGRWRLGGALTPQKAD